MSLTIYGHVHIVYNSHHLPESGESRPRFLYIDLITRGVTSRKKTVLTPLYTVNLCSVLENSLTKKDIDEIKLVHSKVTIYSHFLGTVFILKGLSAGNRHTQLCPHQ